MVGYRICRTKRQYTAQFTMEGVGVRSGIYAKRNHGSGMRILVTGATGFVGSHLIPALLEAGHDVVALVRNRDRYSGPESVTVKQGDLLEPGPGGFEHALSGIDAGYYLVHSMHSGPSFEERDRRAARNFARAASESDIERVIYLGGLGANGDRLSRHLRSRREVERILESGTYDLTTLRAAIIIGSGSMSYELIRQLTERFPIMVVSTWIQTPCQPISIDDAVEYLTRVLSVPETADDTFEIGGPDVLTYREIVVRIARATCGRQPLVVTVPIHSLRLSTYWVDMVTDIPSSVAKPLLCGVRTPVVVTDTRIRSLIPIELTPFEEAVIRTLNENHARASGET